MNYVTVLLCSHMGTGCASVVYRPALGRTRDNMEESRRHRVHRSPPIGMDEMDVYACGHWVLGNQEDDGNVGTVTRVTMQ